MPRTVYRTPLEPPTRRPVAPAPGATDLPLSCQILREAPKRRSAPPGTPAQARKIPSLEGPNWKVSRPALGAVGAEAPEAGAPAQGPDPDVKVDSRAPPARCPWTRGRRPQQYLASRVGGRAVLRSGRCCRLCSRLSAAAGDEGRPAPPPARPRPANPWRPAGGGAGLGRGGAPSLPPPPRTFPPAGLEQRGQPKP